jgi:hypothetical protein
MYCSKFSTNHKWYRSNYMLTGYDWGHVSSETMGEEESFEVLAEVPPGLILTIEQAVGHCNGNDAKTELFRISHTLKDGTLVNRYLEKTLPDGSTVKFSPEIEVADETNAKVH